MGQRYKNFYMVKYLRHTAFIPQVVLRRCEARTYFNLQFKLLLSFLNYLKCNIYIYATYKNLPKWT